MKKKSFNKKKIYQSSLVFEFSYPFSMHSAGWSFDIEGHFVDKNAIFKVKDFTRTTKEDEFIQSLYHLKYLLISLILTLTHVSNV